MIRASRTGLSRGDRFCQPAISPPRAGPRDVLVSTRRCLKGTESDHPKTFADLGVPARIVDALTARGITSPFPIQAETLPDTLAGRDVLGRGKTGSGKTLAFSIPLVGRLSTGNRRPARPTGLVLAPTRELATQITATLEPLAAAAGLRVSTIFGGVSQHRQVAALKAGVDIVVACPGRLEDLMRQRLITLEAVRVTVIDEADHMADLGFLPGVTRILAATPNDGQRLLFSATLDNGWTSWSPGSATRCCTPSTRPIRPCPR